jgi:adenine-specific DNA-methyltransferase
MAKQLQKLELTWIGKGNEPKLEPRILIEDPSKSYGNIHSENMLIHGDNLLALKALEQQFATNVKCIYIDPPYNTGSAFEHYDDGIEHSLWLSLMKPRLDILRTLLRDDGSIWISIDDNECHYLKVLCDEVFGRTNFVGTVIWEKRYSPQNAVKWFSESHDFILVYSKNKSKWYPNLLERSDEMNARYRNLDNDPRGAWKPADATAQGGHGTKSQFYVLTAPNGKQHTLPNGRCWVYTEPVFKQMIADNRIWFGASGNNVPAVKRFLSEVKQGTACQTIWKHVEVGHNQEAKKEIIALFGAVNLFDTPKPERLIERILTLATRPGDLVLDSFLGSGTTASVAHKMNRRWIGIELGEHAKTHCLPRLQKVVSGEDKGGVTEAVKWQGGGGFKFYTLAPSLIQEDKYGSEIINPTYNRNMLAAAMAKQEGFRYSPDENNYWKQGFSSEKDFIFTTTQFITVQMLDRLAEELKEGESLLVCCKSFAKGCTNRYSNITIKKIPQMLLGRCEFGKDDYSFNIVNLPHEDKEKNGEDKTDVSIQINNPQSKKKKADDSQSNLFS